MTPNHIGLIKSVLADAEVTAADKDTIVEQDGSFKLLRREKPNENPYLVLVDSETSMEHEIWDMEDIDLARTTLHEVAQAMPTAEETKTTPAVPVPGVKQPPVSAPTAATHKTAADDSGWIVTYDHLDNKEVEVMGPNGISENVVQRLKAGEGQEFQMLDADNVLYYTGRVLGSDVLAPLDDYGTPNAGAVALKIKENGVWKSVN